MSLLFADECGQSDRCPDRHVCRYTEDGLSKCECRTGWNGTKCRTNPDNCINNDCENGEECVDMLDDYVCIELIPPTETPSPTPAITTDKPTSRTTSPTAVTVISPSATTSSAGVSDIPTSITTGSSTATTTQGAPTSGSSLGTLHSHVDALYGIIATCPKCISCDSDIKYTM